jgi:hypothetical protein
MDTYEMLKYSAWVLSAIFGLWMLFDMIKTNRAYADDVLMSSKEGEIEDKMDGAR